MDSSQAPPGKITIQGAEHVSFLKCSGSLLVALILLSGCAGTVPSYRVHHSLLDSSKAKLPERVVLLPIAMEVSEISAGGVAEEVQAWSDQATQNVEDALKQYDEGDASIELVALPPLSASHAEAVQQHLALYDVVGGTAFSITNSPVAAWDHKRKHFDYTLGQGLEFLREQSGADTALVVIGMDQISSSERKALAVGAAILGVSVPLGQSFLSVGIVDLKSGDLLWLNYAYSYGNLDLREADDSVKMIQKMFEAYPGIDAYRQYAAK